MAEFSIESIKEAISQIHIPILTLDERYNIVMPDKDKTPEIRKLEAKVNGLLKKQGKVTTNIKEVKKIKARLMQDVVDNMDEDGSEAHQKKMNQTQRLLKEAKQKLEELEDRELDIPRELQEANKELLLEFIQVCYGRLHTNREDIELLDRWIKEMRVELKKKLVIKQEKELKNNNIYTYMHDLLGPDLIQKFDEADSSGE